MKVDKETQDQLQEMQMIEQNLQNVLLQKQAFEMELSEVESAISETQKSSEEVYKIVGNIMIRADKQAVIKELEEKKKIFSLRLKTLENQEKILMEKLDKSRKDVEEKISNQK